MGRSPSESIQCRLITTAGYISARKWVRYRRFSSVKRCSPPLPLRGDSDCVSLSGRTAPGWASRRTGPLTASSGPWRTTHRPCCTHTWPATWRISYTIRAGRGARSTSWEQEMNLWCPLSRTARCTWEHRMGWRPSALQPVRWHFSEPPCVSMRFRRATFCTMIESFGGAGIWRAAAF